MDTTHNKKLSTVVVIPIYRQPIESEAFSLQQCVRMLGKKYPLVLLHPHRLDVQPLLNTYACLEAKALDDACFESLEAYNFMMLSTWFYQLFAQYDYMLIYQLDAFIFSDDLETWVNKGYDYIGAPWMPSTNLFQLTIGDAIRWVRKRLQPAGSTPVVTHAQLHYSVGNGGFCLRRIQKMIEITTRFKKEIDSITFGSRTAMEDVFLCIYLKKRAQLHTPGWREAVGFSMECALPRCLRVNGGHLPLGCHAWSKRQVWQTFWHKYIPCNPHA